MLNLTYELSDVSRTNQLKILDNPEEVAEKLFQYLYKRGKGIDLFPPSDIRQESDSKTNFIDRHQRIKEEVKNRLVASGQPVESKDIQYFLGEAGGENYVFFLSPAKHSGWKDLFTSGEKYREKIFNLVFKLHLISQLLPFETVNGFEELLLIHSQKESKTKDALFVWGQSVYVHFNKHQVLSLYLTRQNRLFVRKDYQTLDGDALGDIILSPKGSTRYFYKSKLDARKKNDIDFMRFDADDEQLEKFKKTQLYYYQKLMTELECFLDACGIRYAKQDFQADAYLEHPFVNQQNLETIKAFDSLAIINNTGTNFTTSDREFLRNFFMHQGIAQVQFYFSGQTVSEYEKVPGESDDDTSWRIYEAIPWISVKLVENENYLVFNKTLDEEDAGSMAYQRKDDGLWTASSEVDDEDLVDFYSDLKRRFTYVNKKSFYSMQGVNVKSFVAVGDEHINDTIVMRYAFDKKDEGALLSEALPFTDGLFLDVPSSILAYLQKQTDKKAWDQFCNKYKIRITPEFQKILSELGIKSWIREGLRNHSLGLPVTQQQFQEHTFWTIYVSSPRRGEAKAVAVKFLYQAGKIYIQDTLSDLPQIRQKFPFLRSWRKKNDEGEGKLFDDQQYFADEQAQIFINCYTSKAFTPTLIGRPHLLEDLENGNLKINRTTKGDNSSRILPVVMYYNRETDPVKSIQDRICFDTKKSTYIQYYVPPKMGVSNKVKRGFRVYHLCGYTYQWTPLNTEEMVNNPIVALHFNTLTQNVLKIGENSQSSLLQKVARVLIEN